MLTIAGLRIVESLAVTVPVEDWSDVRSPARARRRLKRGFPQRIRIRQEPDPNVYRIGGALHMHPETARKLRHQLQASPKDGGIDA